MCLLSDSREQVDTLDPQEMMMSGGNLEEEPSNAYGLWWGHTEDRESRLWFGPSYQCAALHRLGLQVALLYRVEWCGTILYSVNYVLNKCWLASSQAGSIGGTTRQEVEAGQWEQENSGKDKAHSSLILSRHWRSRMWPALLKKVLSHVANIY